MSDDGKCIQRYSGCRKETRSIMNIFRMPGCYPWLAKGIKAIRWPVIGFLFLWKFFWLASFYGWDETFFLSQLISPICDGDLFLQNNIIASNLVFSEKFRALTITFPSGALKNAFGAGFAVTHGWYTWPVLLLSDPVEYRNNLYIAIMIGSMLAFIITVQAIARLIETVGYSKDIGYLSAYLSIISGPLFFYGLQSYGNSHLLSAFWSVLMIHSCVRWLEHPRIMEGIQLGLTAGMMGISRWQDNLIWGCLAVPILFHLLFEKKWDRSRTYSFIAVVLSFFSVITIQYSFFYIQYGEWFLRTHEKHFMHWSQPHIRSFLFSSYNGLLPWAPVFAIGLIGIYFSLWKPMPVGKKRLLIGLTASIPIAIYISACPFDWWGGSSYGPRRLSSLTPMAGLGLACVLTNMKTRHRVLFVFLSSVWAIVTLSAHRYYNYDLSLLFFGKPDPFKSGEQIFFAHAGRWETPFEAFSQGVAKILSHRFTLVSKAHTWDYFQGALIIFSILLISSVCLKCWERFRWGRNIIVASFSLWTVVVLFWALVFAPSNTTWNSDWQNTLEGKIDEWDEGEFPRGFVESASVIGAVRAAYLGDFTVFMHYIGNIDFNATSIDWQVITEFVNEPQQREFISRFLFK